MRYSTQLRIGPVGFRIGSDWRAPIAALETLYAGYPQPDGGIADFNVHLFARRPWRKWLRPSVEIGGDFILPDAAPLPLALGLLAAEMGMNLQMALGQRRYLLIHASAVERDGQALLMTGESGAGKSTLAALLMARGWRLMGDEFALIDPETGLVHAFPRLISLKNESIGVMEATLRDGMFGPLLAGTPKGDIRHLRPDARALAAMDAPARARLILFPRFGSTRADREVLPSETFVRLTQASTNYVTLAERGFDALTRLVQDTPARALDYPDTETALAEVERLWFSLSPPAGRGWPSAARSGEGNAAHGKNQTGVPLSLPPLRGSLPLPARGERDSGTLLAQVLRDPISGLTLDPSAWNALLAVARAEQLIGTLAHRLDGLALPPAAARVLEAARWSADQGRTAALWEAEMARRALAPSGMPVVLLKGTAFVAAGLQAGVGRSIGDLDILVPRDRIEEAEALLIGAGWEWVKPDPYDDQYYRRWMHELPPLIHRDRDRMIDVHHTILPLTARITPDAEGLIAESLALENGLRVLSPNDMLCHAAAHLFADGDLAGGMRNLWDIHCLIEEFGTEGLQERAEHHGLWPALWRAVRQSHQLYGTQIPESWRVWDSMDPLYLRRLTARNGWGRQTRRLTRLGFYVRSHWLRMPPAMLARHLWTKWRKGGVPG